MPITPLDSLASYTTPVQTDQNAERGDTSGQKRKRDTRDARDLSEHETESPRQSTTNSNTLSQPRQTSHLHAPTPSPTRPLPAYNFPRFDRELSPPQPVSPTSEAQKRRKTLNQKNQEPAQTHDHDMEMDAEGTRATDQGNTTPTPGTNRNWYEQSPARQGREPQENFPDNTNSLENAAVEIDEQENARTLARIMAASGSPLEPDNGKPFLNPLDKYTKGPMPDIHDEDPATLLESLDTSQIKTWLELTTGKVLARPLDTDVNYQKNHQHIAKALMAAAKEITGSASVAVAPPNKDRSGQRQRSKRHPITFLIHGMSKRDTETLLERKVWSSKEISFQVAPINICRPRFLFTLNGLATQDETKIAPILKATWSDPVTSALLQKLASKAPEPEQANAMSKLEKFLESTSIKPLNIKTGGGKDDTHFNVYADGDIIEDDESWLELRRHLRSRTYKSALYGDGNAIRDNYICGLCHAHDHPRGLCPFPDVPGWNGGGRNKKKSHINTSNGDNHFQNGQPSRENFRDNNRYRTTSHNYRK